MKKEIENVKKTQDKDEITKYIKSAGLSKILTILKKYSDKYHKLIKQKLDNLQKSIKQQEAAKNESDWLYDAWIKPVDETIYGKRKLVPDMLLDLKAHKKYCDIIRKYFYIEWFAGMVYTVKKNEFQKRRCNYNTNSKRYYR